MTTAARGGGRARSRCPVGAVLLAAAATAACGSEPAFVLDLPGGGRLPGGFVETPPGDGPRSTLAWRSPLFEVPFEFWIDEIVGIRCPTRLAEEPLGGFGCRLQGGDLIDGELRGIDARHVVLEPPGGPPLRIDRAVVTSIGRREAGGVAGYVGPGGLAGWTQSPESAWRDEAGRIVSDIRNATVSRDVSAPPRARFDLVLSWREKPELSLAVAAAGGSEVDPYRFEMLSAGAGGPVAMLVRQDAKGARLEPVELPAAARGRLQLTLFVDQAAGRLAAAVAGAAGIVDMTVPPAGGRAASTRFRLRLMSGDVSLETLRVSAWQSPEPVMADPDVTRVSWRDGPSEAGEVVSLDEAGKLVVKTPGGEITRDVAELEEIAFGADGPPEAEEATVRVVRHGGGVLTGDLVGVGEGSLAIARQGIDRPVVVPLADVQTLISLRSAEPRPLPGRMGTIAVGDAELSGCLVDAARWGGGIAWQPRGSVAGSPLAAAPADGVSAVVEYVPKPRAVGDDRGAQVEVGGIGGVINQDGEGFFVVAMLSEEGAAARDGRIEPGDRILAIRPAKDTPFVETKGLELATVMNLLRGRVGTPVGLKIGREGDRPRGIDITRGLIYLADRHVMDEALAVHARLAAGQLAAAGEAAGYPAVLVLRSGDVVPAAIERIDAEGVRVRSPATASTDGEAVVVAHPLVRAIELDPAAASRAIEKAQWERLLTLPRSQEADPPTHLLRLRSGDYLRGKLESLDADEVRFDVLGQSKRLPREAVVRIIALHPDEIERPADAAAGGPPAQGDGVGAPPPADAAGLVVQGISAGGGRTTLLAERMDGPAIVGTSPAFGPGRIDTLRIDRLLVGRAVGAGDEELPFAKWRLRPAPLPRALRD